MNKKIKFDDFIVSVPIDSQKFIEELHYKMIEYGCTVQIKLARSGYMVAYLYNKKTIANYVFRKKGMFVRIYGVHVKEYEKILDTLPDEMINSIQSAPICKRLIDPSTCNPKCPMGYDFFLKNEHYQKCRNSAFMFLVCPQNNSFIQSLLLNEVDAWQNKLVTR